MRSRAALAVAGVAAAAVAVVLSRRRRSAPEEAAPDPADELRRKLEQSRTLATERDEFEAGETTVDAVEPAEPVSDRRRRVHERGHAALDEMRGDDEPEAGS